MIFEFLFQLKLFFFFFFFKSVNIVSSGKNKKKITLTLQEIIAKLELDHQKKHLDVCSSTLEFFLVKCVNISIFVS